MRTLKFFFMTLMAMTVLAGASAFAQQGARRNSSVTTRQETKAEKKQTQVNEVQKPANVVNQAATDAKMRQAGGTQSDRRTGGSSSSSGSVSNGGKTGTVNSNVGKNGNSGTINNGNGKAGNSGNASHGSGYGNGQRPPVNNGGNHGNNGYNGGHGGAYPGGYTYPGSRPPMPRVRTYDRYQLVTRTNASEIVIRTVFRTKQEAYDYVARLLDERFFSISSYGNGYSWMETNVAFVPTPYEWTDPLTHNQFRIRVNITKSLGTVRVSLSGEWRESILSSVFSILRFQPSDPYSTYYAWNILEDIAEDIPGYSISYR